MCSLIAILFHIGLSVNVLMPGQSGFSEILRPLGSHYPDASERTKTRMIQCVR
jgi:hypothetical protein